MSNWRLNYERVWAILKRIDVLFCRQKRQKNAMKSFFFLINFFYYYSFNIYDYSLESLLNWYKQNKDGQWQESFEFDKIGWKVWKIEHTFFVQKSKKRTFMETICIKGNWGAQRSPQSGRKSDIECKGKRELDCKTYKSSRNESWP